MLCVLFQTTLITAASHNKSFVRTLSSTFGTVGVSIPSVQGLLKCLQMAIPYSASTMLQYVKAWLPVPSMYSAYSLHKGLV